MDLVCYIVLDMFLGQGLMYGYASSKWIVISELKSAVNLCQLLFVWLHNEGLRKLLELQ